MSHRSLLVNPSRLLNDQRGIFGLWMTDFAAGVGIFMGGSRALDDTGFELLSIPAAVIFLIVLSPIRLSTRRKIVRDFIRNLCTRKVIYDPSK